MLVCDQIIAEQGSNKKSLIGIFENIYARAFPTGLPRVSVYVRLTDVEKGRIPFRLRLVRLKDESPIFDIDVEADVTNPFAATELAFNMGGLLVPEPGKYEFQLYTNDVYLHRVTMDAMVILGGPPWQQPQKPPTKH